MFSKVLFPAPEAPNTARIVPRVTVRSTPDRTSRRPAGAAYALRRPAALKTTSACLIGCSEGTYDFFLVAGIRSGGGSLRPDPGARRATPGRAPPPGTG